jgi:ribonuclease HI
MGLGALICAPDGQQHTLSQATDARGCNNEAELRALMAALHLLHSLGARAVQAYSDNSILVAQLAPAAVAASEPIARLAPLFDEARALLAGFDEARLHWVPRCPGARRPRPAAQAHAQAHAQTQRQAPPLTSPHHQPRRASQRNAPEQSHLSPLIQAGPITLKRRWRAHRDAPTPPVKSVRPSHSNPAITFDNDHCLL